MREIEYSVVVPVYNEEGNISVLDKEIKEVMEKLGDYEIIYVNDGSTDKTEKELGKLKGVKVIELNRNYGQATALDAGFKAAKGEIIISLDGDGQNDPRDIPKMLEKMEKEGSDVVAGWRKKRKDKRQFRILTRIGRFLRHILINDKVHDSGCTLRVYKSKAVKTLDLQGEMHRYILALLRWKGFKISEIEVNHRERMKGKTKYGMGKALRGFIDLIHIWFIDKYSQRPLHIFGTLGLVSLFLGLIIEAWMAYDKIFRGIDLSANAWFILGFFLIITGAIFFSFGLTIDLLIKTFHLSSPMEKRYYIRGVEER